MAKSVQVLKQNGKQFKVDTNQLYSIFDKIGNKNFAVVSINGNKRTGKSFMLNYLLRYLKCNDQNITDWINFNGDAELCGFDWRSGAERHTVGVWMWSQPFFVNSTDGSELAILLLDTQGNFDDKSSFQDCALIFAFSSLLSSTLILNMKNDTSEDKLQLIEFFAYFAHSFSGQSTLATTYLFQRLVFLIRDWENESSYPFGHHHQNSPQIKNYKKEVIDPNNNKCLEAQQTRTHIASYFQDLECFLMPHPGLKVRRTDFKGQNKLIDPYFIEYVERFGPIILGQHYIKPKKINGNLVTGESIKAYLLKWIEIIEAQKFAPANTITEMSTDINYLLAHKHALSLYETRIKCLVELNPSDVQIINNHKIAKQECIHYFITQSTVRINEHKKQTLLKDLNNRTEKMFEIYRNYNKTKLEKLQAEQRLNELLEHQRSSLQHNFGDQHRQYEREMNCFQIDSNIAEQLDQKITLIEENGRNLQQMNLECIAKVSEMERQYLADRVEAERTYAQNMVPAIAEITTPIGVGLKLPCTLL